MLSQRQQSSTATRKRKSSLSTVSQQKPTMKSLLIKLLSDPPPPPPPRFQKMSEPHKYMFMHPDQFKIPPQYLGHTKKQISTRAPSLPRTPLPSPSKKKQSSKIKIQQLPDDWYLQK